MSTDDASTDKTREILKLHEKIALIIQNDHWQSGIENRLLSEMRHRGLLLQEARKRFDFIWCICCDADERYIGLIREFVTELIEGKPDAVEIQLFDAYMTEGGDYPYSDGMSLQDSGAFFPERRDILMLWKNSDRAQFVGLDARESVVAGTLEVNFFCQHYAMGKACLTSIGKRLVNTMLATFRGYHMARNGRTEGVKHFIVNPILGAQCMSGKIIYLVTL